MTVPGGAEWRWGCLPCMETGPADSAQHAAALERFHRFFACPHAPGLDPDERQRRQAWSRVRRERYVEHQQPESAAAALHPAGTVLDPGRPAPGPNGVITPQPAPRAEPVTVNLPTDDVPGWDTPGTPPWEE